MSRPVNRQGRVADVASAPALAFDWGSIQWLVTDQLQADSRMTFGFVQIKPGVKNPKHRHPNCDEVLYLIEGELEHSLGEERIHLQPGMAIHIPAGVTHDAVNRGQGVARMVVAYSDGNRQTVMCEAGQE